MQAVDNLKKTLENPVLFNALQFAISGRQNLTRNLIREGLQLGAGEPLLDVCCGTGEFADVALGPYLGIDISPEYIAFARQKYKYSPKYEFLAEDITSLTFRERGLTFPKAMMINSMHHLSVEQNVAVLAAVAEVTTGRFVVIDMNPTPGNPVSRFLAEQDRGDYIRPLTEQFALVQPYFKIEQAYTYYSGLCGQTIIVCSKKI